MKCTNCGEPSGKFMLCEECYEKRVEREKYNPKEDAKT